MLLFIRPEVISRTVLFVQGHLRRNVISTHLNFIGDILHRSRVERSGPFTDHQCSASTVEFLSNAREQLGRACVWVSEVLGVLCDGCAGVLLCEAPVEVMIEDHERQAIRVHLDEGCVLICLPRVPEVQRYPRIKLAKRMSCFKVPLLQRAVGLRLVDELNSDDVVQRRELGSTERVKLGKKNAQDVSRVSHILFRKESDVI